MSHIATIKTQIKDLNAFREALRNMGFGLKAGGSVAFYHGQEVPANFTVTGLRAGAYGLGLQAEPDGSYSFVCDQEAMYDHDNGRNNEFRQTFGPKAGTLMQHYVAAYAPTLAGMTGGVGSYMVQQTENEDGSVDIDLLQYGG